MQTTSHDKARTILGKAVVPGQPVDLAPPPRDCTHHQAEAELDPARDVRLGTPEMAYKKPGLTSARDDVEMQAADVEMQAAKGDDSLMSQVPEALPNLDEIKGKWQRCVGAAKVIWAKLTDDELLQVEGQAQKLAGLVQERYAVSMEEANRQASHFFEQNWPFPPSVEEVKARWQQQIGAAKIAWAKLTDDELLKIEGQAQKLIGLVQERYALTRAEAEYQVHRFFNK